MTPFHLTPHDLAFVLGWLATGGAIGVIYFLSLRWNVRMLAASRALLPVVAVQLGRFVAIALALALVARSFGALALLATALGLVAARTVIVRRET